MVTGPRRRHQEWQPQPDAGQADPTAKKPGPTQPRHNARAAERQREDHSGQTLFIVSLFSDLRKPVSFHFLQQNFRFLISSPGSLDGRNRPYGKRQALGSQSPDALPSPSRLPLSSESEGRASQARVDASASKT